MINTSAVRTPPVDVGDDCIRLSFLAALDAIRPAKPTFND